MQPIPQALQIRQQLMNHRFNSSDIDCCRKGVISGLTHINMVIGMYRIIATQCTAKHFNGAIGDHFINIHIGLRS